METGKLNSSSKLYLATIKRNNGKIKIIKENYQLNFEHLESKKGLIKLNEEKVFVVLRHTYFNENVFKFLYLGFENKRRRYFQIRENNIPSFWSKF